MCQRLLVGYRLELVAICVHAMPYMKMYLRMVDFWRDGRVFTAGDSAGFMQSTLQHLVIFRDHVVFWFNY